MSAMTEEEAATKWCPMARSWAYGGNDDQVTVNRSDTGNPDTACMCVGSRCMAWRFDRYNQNPDGKARGYCGAFGKAES
jgi:hypothetical protein